MAGPIKIAILADANAATRSVKDFSKDVDSSVNGAASSLERGSSRIRAAGKETGKGFDDAVEGADRAEQRAMGFRDTLTGVQDTMKGTSQIAKGDLMGGLLTLGMGLGDLASGFANLLIPMAKKAAAAMKAFNLTMLTNPIFLVIVAIVALVAIFVIAYKKSETFRRIVHAAFHGVLAAARAVWNWIKGNWPLLLAIITGPIGIAVMLVVRHFSRIVSFVRQIPGWIKGAFSGAGSWLVSAGRSIVQGLWNGITGLAGWLKSKVTSFIANTVPGPIRHALGIASPSKVMRQIGQYLPQGLAMGIDDGQQRVRNAAARMSAATVPNLTGSSSTSSTTGTPVVIQFQATGDPLMDAIFTELRKRIRVSGGNVQTVLGR